MTVPKYPNLPMSTFYHTFEAIINKNEMGLFHYDGLLILQCAKGQKMDKTRKNVTEIFKNIEFKTDIVTNLKKLNFLDVTCNLTNGTFRL